MPFFFKELIVRPLYITGGKPIRWEPIGHNGLLTTDDEILIKELRTAVAAKRGGVREITADDYSDRKKNAPTSPFKLEGQPPKLSLTPPHFPRNTGHAADTKGLGPELENQLRTKFPLPQPGPRPPPPRLPTPDEILAQMKASGSPAIKLPPASSFPAAPAATTNKVSMPLSVPESLPTTRRFKRRLLDKEPTLPEPPTP